MVNAPIQYHTNQYTVVLETATTEGDVIVENIQKNAEMNQPIKAVMLYELSLFAGIGGFSLGLEWTGGFEPVAFCENNKKCHLVLKKHWPNKPIYNDVRLLTYERLKKDGITRIDVVTGGFPCQDISTAGKGEGITGARSGLWKEFARIVGEVQPRYVIVENVPALRGRGLSVVLGDLAALRYGCEWHCIPASAIGAPHQRDRIWIIAYPGYVPGSTKQEKQCEVSTEIPSTMCENRVGAGMQYSTIGNPDRGDRNQRQVKRMAERKQGSESARICPDVPIPNGQRCEELRESVTAHKRTGWPEFKCGCQWKVEPELCRVVDELSKRLDKDMLTIYNNPCNSEELLSSVLDNNKPTDSSSRLRPYQQFTRKHKNIMRNVPYQMALEEWENGQQKKEFLMQGLWQACEEIGYVPKTLSEIPKIWESLTDKEKEWITLRISTGNPFCEEWPDTNRLTESHKGRVDRLKQLGNAVVPQIPYIIGMAILEREGTFFCAKEKGK